MTLAAENKVSAGLAHPSYKNQIYFAASATDENPSTFNVLGWRQKRQTSSQSKQNQRKRFFPAGVCKMINKKYEMFNLWRVFPLWGYRND